jgi:hypothetical protein
MWIKLGIAPQQRMQLDRDLRRAKWRPWKQRQTQIDGGGVQRIDRVVQFQAQGFRGIQFPCNTNQRLSELAVHAPVAALVGIGQIAAREVAAQSQMIRLGRVRFETRLDVPQALAKSDLCKCHAQELVQATEGAHVEVAAILGHQTTKGVPRRKLHHLREDELACVHSDLPGKSRQPAVLGLRRSSR